MLLKKNKKKVYEKQNAGWMLQLQRMVPQNVQANTGNSI